MKVQTITLGGEPRVIKTPSYFALQLLKEFGYDLGVLPFVNDFGFVSAFVAACLTDAEPRDATTKLKSYTWTPEEVGDLVIPGLEANELLEKVGIIVIDTLETLYPNLKGQISLGDDENPEVATSTTPAAETVEAPKKPKSQKRTSSSKTASESQKVPTPESE